MSDLPFSYLLTYGTPFVVYFVGVIVRYKATFLRSPDAPPLKEQLYAAIAFSFLAIAPLLPAISLTVAVDTGIDFIAYIFILVVVLQEGLILHEKAVAIVGKLVRDAGNGANRKDVSNLGAAGRPQEAALGDQSAEGN